MALMHDLNRGTFAATDAKGRLRRGSQAFVRRPSPTMTSGVSKALLNPTTLPQNNIKLHMGPYVEINVCKNESEVSKKRDPTW